MPRGECLDLVRQQSVGRIAITRDALPVIHSVDYAFDGTTIVFRAPRDGALAGACRSSVVAFEVDDRAVAPAPRRSVCVVGVADQLDTAETMRVLGLALPTVGGQADAFIGVTVGSVSGRTAYGLDEEQT
jgi:uncharacterized protein